MSTQDYWQAVSVVVFVALSFLFFLLFTGRLLPGRELRPSFRWLRLTGWRAYTFPPVAVIVSSLVTLLVGDRRGESLGFLIVGVVLLAAMVIRRPWRTV